MSHPGTFASLLEWYFNKSQPVGNISRKIELINLAKRITQASHLKHLRCGIELHADDSGRMDIQFHSRSAHIDFSSIVLPSWWPNLIISSDPTPKEVVFESSHFDVYQESIQCPDTSFNDARNARFPGDHWLEFDQLPQEGLLLAGVFQACFCIDRRCLTAKKQFLQHISQVGCLSINETFSSKAIKLVLDCFGVPRWTGFMVGRNNVLKLVCPIDGIPANILHKFCSKAKLLELLPYRDTRSFEFCKTLTELKNDISVALSVDIDIENDMVLPRICFEIFGPTRDKGIILNGAEIYGKLLPLLRDVCGIDEQGVGYLGRAMHGLPYGQKQTMALDGLEVFFREELRKLHSFAFHSHVKVVYEPDRIPYVKSYVELLQSKGKLSNAKIFKLQ